MRTRRNLGDSWDKGKYDVKKGVGVSNRCYRKILLFLLLGIMLRARITQLRFASLAGLEYAVPAGLTLKACILSRGLLLLLRVHLSFF